MEIDRHIRFIDDKKITYVKDILNIESANIKLFQSIPMLYNLLSNLETQFVYFQAQ